MELRIATQQDEQALIALDRATWSPQVSPGPGPTEDPDPDATFFLERRGPNEVLVAEDEGRVVGYAILQQGHWMPSHQHVRIINGFAVDPAVQGRGIGRRLLDFAKAEAVRRGAGKVSLRVLGGNTPARQLYASGGFEVEGILRGEFEIDGHPVDDVLMAWFPDR